MDIVRLEDVSRRESSNLAQKEIEGLTGNYPVYGASECIGTIDFYHQKNDYIAVVKDGAGIGRTMFLPAKSSVIGTLQYIIPNERIFPKYLYFAVKHMKLAKYNTGATIPHIYYKDYKKEIFKLPEISKQKEIVFLLDKIEKIMEEQRQELLNLDILVKSRFVEMFGDPETNTKGWPIVNMCDLCSVGSSKRIYQSEQSSEGVPFWRISDLTNLINTGVVTGNLYIPEKRYAELQDQGQVPAKDDILVTSRGTLGQCYIVKADDKFYFQDGMISWLSQYAEGITPLYISYLFSMSGFRKQIDSMQAGSTVAYLSIAMIKKLKVMVPDEETQQHFAAFVHQVDKLKVAVQKALDKTQVLFDSLMQQYFE